MKTYKKNIIKKIERLKNGAELELLLLTVVKDSSAHFAIKHTRQCRIYTFIVKINIPVNQCQG